MGRRILPLIINAVSILQIILYLIAYDKTI